MRGLCSLLALFSLFPLAAFADQSLCDQVNHQGLPLIYGKAFLWTEAQYDGAEGYANCGSPWTLNTAGDPIKFDLNPAIVNSAFPAHSCEYSFLQSVLTFINSSAAKNEISSKITTPLDVTVIVSVDNTVNSWGTPGPHDGQTPATSNMSMCIGNLHNNGNAACWLVGYSSDGTGQMGSDCTITQRGIAQFYTVLEGLGK